MPVRVDFTGVESREFAPHPAGDYEATISKIEQRTSSTGNPMMTWEFDVDAGGKAWMNTSLTPQALWKLKQVLTRLGVLDETSEIGEVEFDERELVGEKVVLTLSVREYQGKERNQVEDVKAYSEATAGGW